MAGATAVAWGVSARFAHGPGLRGGAWSAPRWSRWVRPWAKELTLMLVLYGLWQYAGSLSLGRRDQAMARGRDIWHFERLLPVPNERSVQHLVLGHRTLVHWLNEFYAEVHVPALGICLVWLFVRHRARYPPLRTVVALVTGACLLIQMFPTAPPRLLAGIGIIDTGAVIGPSDYAGGAPGIDQLSAMPSVHVAWALIVGGAVVWASRSRWRWLGALYPAATLFVVVATGNHYWADGVVAAVLCALATAVVVRAYRLRSPVAAGVPARSAAPAQDLVGVGGVEGGRHRREAPEA